MGSSSCFEAFGVLLVGDSFLPALLSLAGEGVFWGLSFFVSLAGVSGMTSEVFKAVAAALAASLLAGVTFGSFSGVCGNYKSQ